MLPIAPLRHFIQKQNVFNLYRLAIRASRGELFYLLLLPLPTVAVIPDPVARKETVSWIRAEFERNKHITDLVRSYPNAPLYLTHPPCFPSSKDLVEDKLRAGRRELGLILPYRRTQFHSRT